MSADVEVIAPDEEVISQGDLAAGVPESKAGELLQAISAGP